MIHRRSQPVVIAERQMRLGDRVVPYVVKRSSVARQVRFEIKPVTGLTVVLPKRCDVDSVDKMLESKRRWILKNLDRYVAPAPAANNGRLKFGDAVPLLGVEVRVVKGDAPGSEVSIRLQGQSLVVRPGLERYDLESIVEAWYRAQAATILMRKARDFAAAFGVAYGRFSVRGQRTRWGSCSHRGTLSFNWRLIMAPEPVVDYVVIHEVAHLKEMNHTIRFWALVAERCPSWREHKKWLNDHGTQLAAVLSRPQ